MPTTISTDVLICGAGAAGLTLAIDLARRGLSFRLIDKSHAPFPGSRGKGIQPRTQEIFEDLGILDRIVAIGGVYPIQRKYRPDGSFTESHVVEPVDPTPAEPFHIPLMAPQFLTERVMRERLLELGHVPNFGRELAEFAQDERGVTARLVGEAGEEIVRARYLVGADGGRSFVRHALDIAFSGKTLGVRAVVADVELTGLDREAWHLFNEGDMEQHLSLCPLGGTDLFQVQAPTALEGEADLSAGGLSALVSERTGREDIVVRSVSWASAYNMNARLADRYRIGRVFLTGDAAHIHPPTGGQGLNTSVQDAYNLAWKLAAVLRGAPSALLDSYEEERRPVASTMLGLATRLLKDTRNGSMTRGREVQQLDVGYPASSLSMNLAGSSRGLRAGDRAPDAPLAGAAGQPRRLFELFRGGHWTLLGYGSDRSRVHPRPGLHVHLIGEDGDVADAGNHFHDTYGLERGDWVLVRPDGYICTVAGPDQLQKVYGHLARVGLGGQAGADL